MPLSLDPSGRYALDGERRLPVRDLGDGLRSVGQASAHWKDLYHRLITLGWPTFLVIMVASYVLTNALFAVIYWLIPGSIGNAVTFTDHFFFSVQTWATIGYGGMTPQTTLANWIVVVESLTGIVFLALLTGIIFAKFSRTDARIVFANQAVVCRINGVSTLVVRTANERGSRIVQAEARVTLLQDTITTEGMSIRRLVDLQLVRSTTPFFRASWLVMHTIDEQSPLWGVHEGNKEQHLVRLIINIMGFDASVGQMSHATALYEPAQLRFGHRYRDASVILPDRRSLIDYRRLHDIEPEPPITS
jgi:inward rectifier potassium channel